MKQNWRWLLSTRTRRFFWRIVQSVAVYSVLLISIGVFVVAVDEVQQENPSTVKLNLYVLFFVFQLAVIGFILSRQEQLPWYLREIADLRHEFTGALVLAGLLLFLVTIPAEQKSEYQLKQQLIREMGSGDSGIALRAGRELEVHGWLYDGSLNDANLRDANLQGVILEKANLQGADLWRASLWEANLWEVNLQGANLARANLQEASLWRTNLQGATLWRTNLQGATLWEANLQGAILLEANLQGADLWRTNLWGS